MLAVTQGSDGRGGRVCVLMGDKYEVLGAGASAQQPGTGPKHNKRWRIDMRDQKLCPGAAPTAAAR